MFWYDRARVAAVAVRLGRIAVTSVEHIARRPYPLLDPVCLEVRPMRAILYLQPASAAGATALTAPALFAACLACTPWVERDPIGGLYCDLSAATWTVAQDRATALLRDLAPAAPPAAFQAGLAAGRFPAHWAATQATPGTLRLLPPETAGAALAPLPLTLLPGLTPVQLRLLHELRIFTLGDLAALPTPLLRAIGGVALPALQTLARGDDAQPVQRARLAAPAPPTAHTPVGHPSDASALLRLLDTLAADLAATLATRMQAAGALTLTVGFAGTGELSHTVRLPHPTTAAAGLQTAAAPRLGQLLRAHRRRPAWQRLTASRCCAAAEQPDLLAPPAPTDPLETVVVAIRQRFGVQSIHVGVPRA